MGSNPVRLTELYYAAVSEFVHPFGFLSGAFLLGETPLFIVMNTSQSFVLLAAERGRGLIPILRRSLGLSTLAGVSLLLLSATCPHIEAGYAKPPVSAAILNMLVRWLLKQIFFNTSKTELLENWGIGSFKDMSLKCLVVVKGHRLNPGSQAHID